MLWRYVGVTLVALGGAMLVAPEAEEETASAPRTAASPLPEAGASAGSPPAAAPDAAPETETLLPAALDLATDPAAATDADAKEGSDIAGRPGATRRDPAVSDAPARPGAGPAAPSRSDRQAATAPAPAELPSLERPDSLRATEMTEETLALVEASGDPEAPTGESAGGSESDLLFVSGSRVNVRSGPSTSYGVIGTTVYGEAVELLAFENDSWAWVRFGDDRQGYMARNFLAPDLEDG